MSLSNDIEGKILDELFDLAAWTAPTGLYASLHTGDPGETGANEVTGNGYARVSIGIGSSNWTRSGGTVDNDNAITFTGPTPSDWGTVTHFGLWDAASVGNFIGGGALDASRVTVVDVDLSFAAGDFNVTLD